ncbi:putative general negative regulator of transcription C16C9.04c [Yarrowia sp. B02]|nr:putative general negative regulator of transcription C16C9.04c [Yarrowia sp. B02]
MAFQADSFISDEEEEVCPLCVEEMDISDRNFKPCPCGYQICQFCYNNIRQNPQLNGRCPGCRRPYDDESVEYKVISPEEWKKHHVKQTKQERERKQKEREKKEMEQSSRKHLSGMRVIQKNLVYVIGLNPDIPTEDLHNTLRGEQFFGQYGRIQKIVINRRNNVNGTPGLGVYVTFAKKEDAARCIAAVDGSMNDGKYLRAAYGTTKYCSSYLRGQPCPNPNCMFLHEPGEEADSYTRQDLSTIQHAARQGIQKQQRQQQQQQQRYGDFQHSQPSPVQPNTPLRHQSGHAAVAHHATEDIHGNALPATASWAKQSPTNPAGKLHTPAQASPVKPAPVEPAVNYPMPDPDPKRQMDFTLPLFKNTLKSLSKNKFDFVFSSAILKSLDLDDDKTPLPQLFAFSKGNIIDPAKHESTEFLEGQFTPFAIFSGGKSAGLPLASDETQSFQQLMKGGPTDKVPDQAATPPPGLMGDSNPKQHHSQELLAHLMNGGKKETPKSHSHNVKSVLAAGYEDASLSLSASPPRMPSALAGDERSPEETLKALSEGPMTLTRDFDPASLVEETSASLFGPPPGLSAPPGLSTPPPGLSAPPGLSGPLPGLYGPRPDTAVYNAMKVDGFDKSPLAVNRPAVVRPEPFHAHISMTPGIGFGTSESNSLESDGEGEDDEEHEDDDDSSSYRRAVGPPQDDDIDLHADDLRSVTSGGAPSEIDFAGSRPATPDLDLPEPPRILSSEHISVLSKNEKRKYRNSLKAYEREKKLAIKNYRKEQEDAERAERAALTTVEEEEAQAKKALAQKACEEVEDAAEALKKALEAAEAEKKAKEAAAEEEARVEKQRLKKEKEKIKAEKARVKAEKALKAKEEKEKRDAERLKRAELKKEKERLEQERLEKEKTEKEQLEKAEKERYEKSLLAMKKEKAEKMKREKAEKERLEKERLEKERAEKEKLRLEKAAKEAAAKKEQEEKAAAKSIVAPQPKLASNMSTSTWDEDDSASSLNYSKPSHDDYRFNSYNSGSSRRGASGQIGGHLADYLASPSPKPSTPSVASTPDLEPVVSATSTASTAKSHVPAGASTQFSVGDLLRSIVEETDLAEHPVFDIQNPDLFHEATIDVMSECGEPVDVFEKAVADQLLTEPTCPDMKEFVSEDIEKFIADSSDTLLHMSKEIDEDVFIDDLDLDESDDDPMRNLPEFARNLITKHAHLIDPKWQEVAVHIDDPNQVDDEELPYRQNLAEEVFQLQNEVDKCLSRNQRLIFRHTGKRFGEDE